MARVRLADACEQRLTAAMAQIQQAIDGTGIPVACCGNSTTSSSSHHCPGGPSGPRAANYRNDQHQLAPVAGTGRQRACRSRRYRRGAQGPQDCQDGAVLDRGRNRRSRSGRRRLRLGSGRDPGNTRRIPGRRVTQPNCSPSWASNRTPTAPPASSSAGCMRSSRPSRTALSTSSPTSGTGSRTANCLPTSFAESAQTRSQRTRIPAHPDPSAPGSQRNPGPSATRVPAQPGSQRNPGPSTAGSQHGLNQIQG